MGEFTTWPGIASFGGMGFSVFGMVFMSAAQRRLLAKGVPIYTYHAVGNCPPGAADPYLYVRVLQLDRQLTLLDQAGYEPATLDDALQPKNTARQAVITFDDGYASTFLEALPILCRHKARAIQFLVAKHIGGKNQWMPNSVAESLMDAAQVKEWLAVGQQIGSHTLTHPILPQLPMDAAREEIFGSKKHLEDLFGRPVRHFCYPGGHWNQAVRDLVAEAGYETACTTDFGVNTPATPRHALRRIVPLTRRELIAKIMHRLLRAARRGA